MARGLLIFVSVLVAGFASLYQFFLKDILTITFGIGRVIGRIEDFPYSCRRVVHPQLEACEDLWIDEKARVLYAACAGVEGRANWNPAIESFNAHGRRPGGSELIALDIDTPGSDGLFNLRAIKTVGFVSAAGDEATDFLGFDVEEVDAETLHFFIVNNGPPVDAEKKFLDAASVGANTTIEVFELKRGEGKMKHLRTVFSPAIVTPNRVAAVGDGAFVVSNDHSVKVGLRRELDAIIGGGSIAYCSSTNECHIASNTTLKFPNGLCRGADKLIYVPSSVDGTVKIFELTLEKSLALVETLLPGMPLDNISPDARGNLWVPGFPNLDKAKKWMDSPLVNESPATVFKIQKTETGEFVIEKAVEDAEVSVLSGITTVRHDVKTGRLFLGGVYNRYIAVCEPKKGSK